MIGQTAEPHGGCAVDRDELAYLSDGRRRVALAALATLLLEGRMRLSHAGKLYPVAGAEAGDPVLEAALAQRATLKESLAALAEHESVRAVEEDLLRRGLVTRGLLGRFRRPTPEGMRMVEEARTVKGRGQAIAVALNGLAGISDDSIKRQFGAAKAGPLRGQGQGGWDARDYDSGSPGGSM
ncbi:TIGR04222 domain-containing membrane protein [Nonomuraea sp. NPDC049625]|uniref:TIGR04222 domain-containing membrane protein n=1 Tax=Nonomuraea sp. NPDC049625 TaxID=3155775 RepID=UPI00343F8C04